MNQARAAEANKHRLAVARALLAKDGLVKHVLYQGKSILYVCLPALHEEFLNSHRVYIPSYTSFVKTLDHPLALKDRLHSHRFHPQATKTAALAYRWPPKRDSLPTAEELADLLHLDESSGFAGLKPAAAGVPAGSQPPVATPEAAANCEAAKPAVPADSHVQNSQNAPTAINPLFQVLPKGVGLKWGRRSKAALQMRQQLWELKQQQQQLQQAVITSWGSSESPQQSIEESAVKEKPALAGVAESQEDAKQLATEKRNKPSARIPSYMVLRQGQGQQLQGQRLNAGNTHRQKAGSTAAAAAAVASVVGDAAADIAAAAAAAQQQGGSGDPANGGSVAVQNISNGGAGGNSGGSGSNKGGQGVAPSDGQTAAAASNAAAARNTAAAAASKPAAGAAAASNAAASSNGAAPSYAAITTAAVDSKERWTPQQDRNFVANSRTGSCSNLLAGQQQHQPKKSRKRSSSEEALQQQQQDNLWEGRKKQRTAPLLASLGASNAVAAAAAAAAASAYHHHQQQQQGSKPSIRRLPVGMQVADMQQQQCQQQQQQWQQLHGHQQQQQQQGVSCAAPMGSQQVMQQQLKQMLGFKPDFMNPTPHPSFISVGCQQQQQVKPAENSNGATPQQQKQQRHPAWQTEQASQQQQYVPAHSMKPAVLPLPAAMQVGRKTEQQRQQLQIAFRQAWQQQQQHKGHHWQQHKPSNLKPRYADLNDVVRAAGRPQGGDGVARQQLAVGLVGQPGRQLSGPSEADRLGQPGAHVSGQPADCLSGQAGAHVSGQPGSRSSGQAAEAAGKFSMKAVFSGRQLKRLQQLLKEQHDEDAGAAHLQQQEQPGTYWQQQDYQYQLQGSGTQLQQHDHRQQQHVFSTPASACVQKAPEAQHVLAHAAAQQNHSSSLPLKRKPLETGWHLLGSTAAVPAAAAVGISACDYTSLLPPPQRRKRVSSDAGLMSKPYPGVECTLNPDESQEVTSLLAAVCVMVGAASLQHLVAAIDQLLLPGTGASDVPRQGGRDQAGNKQQQQSAVGLSSRSGGAAAAAAAARSTRQSAAPTAATEKGGISKELLSAVRWLAMKLGCMRQQQQQQQELVIPTLQQLCQVRPCLLDAVSTLDGNHVLSVTEEQLQAFLAGILAVELQQSMQRLGMKAVQNNTNELHTNELVAHQQQKLVVLQQQPQQQQQQQQQVASVSADNKIAGGSAVNAPTQPQQQRQVLIGVPNTGEGGGSAANALLQQQQQFAMALMSEYQSGGRVVCCKPKTLMILAAHRTMAALAQELVQQQEGRVGLTSPAAQAAAAAAVAARLAERELQLAAARSGLGSSQQLPGGGFRGSDNSAAAAGSSKRLTAGNSSSSATTAAAGGEQSASLSSSSSKAGLHVLNALLLRSQFHPELRTGMLCVDMPNCCAVAAAAAGTTSDLKISSAAMLVFGFSLQDPQGLQSVGHTQGLGDAGCFNPAEPVPEAEPKPSADQVLATWLCVGPDVVLWRKLVALLLQFQQQQQQQQGEEGKETPSNAPQQYNLQQYNLQQCYTNAQEVLHNLQLQPADLAHIHSQLKHCTPSASHQQQQQHDSGVVLQQHTLGRGVLLTPGWLHLRVNHKPNVTLWFDVLRACDAAAAAVVQRDMPWALTPELQSAAVQVGPLVLKTLQRWHAYCQQQQQ